MFNTKLNQIRNALVKSGQEISVLVQNLDSTFERKFLDPKTCSDQDLLKHICSSSPEFSMGTINSIKAIENSLERITTDNA